MVNLNFILPDLPYKLLTFQNPECQRIWVRKLESNNLTKTKNWSGRNEVIETSGRLHPLWPQDKRLHTPRTADYRHTWQDRWIQTELAFTLAKNATKPNPFEIIPLQTTRKENSWKTEETLKRAAVTLETERIKGSNPWCLWWWWWWLWWWWWWHWLISVFRRDVNGIFAVQGLSHSADW